jgi:hypothetical protein
VSTQSARFGLHAKQCFLSELSTRDVDQSMAACRHKIKTLTMYILQMGIANG